MTTTTEHYDRDFKGVWIESQVWLNRDVTWLEKCLLAEIDSLDKGEGCFASNAHLAKMFNVSEGEMANKITSLRKRRFLKTLKFDGRMRFLRSAFSSHRKSRLQREPEGSVQEPTESRHHGSREHRYKKRNKSEKSGVDTPHLNLIPPSINGFPKTRAGNYCKQYYQFLVDHNLQKRKAYKGRIITVHPEVRNWSAACDQLLETVSEEDFEEVLEWYFENYNHPRILIHKSFAAFCFNFKSLQKDMFRQQRRNPNQCNGDDSYEGEKKIKTFYEDE